MFLFFIFLFPPASLINIQNFTLFSFLTHAPSSSQNDPFHKVNSFVCAGVLVMQFRMNLG